MEMLEFILHASWLFKIIFLSIICFLGIANAIIFRLPFWKCILVLVPGNILALFLLMKLMGLSLVPALLFCTLPGIVMGIFFRGIQFYFFKTQEPEDVFTINFPVKKGKKLVINIKRALGIFGAMGAGKTRSGFVPVIFHCAKNSLPVLCYDYKDKELSEWVNCAYRSSPTLPLKFVCPAEPNFSHRVNPIHPSYLNKFDDVNTLSNALVTNLGDYSGAGNGNRIFLEIAEAALAGVIWKTKESYPDLCDLAHVAAILMTKSFEALFDYIKTSHYASLLAKPLLDSSDTDRQLAAIMTTLSNAFRKIVSPELFAIFSGHDIELAINHPDHLCALNIINHPKYDTALTPFLATLTKCVIMQMAERHRHPAVFILDEAGTIKIGDLDKVLKTLRSYNIAVVLGIQDKIDGIIMYGEQKFLSIMANLNAKIIGKANDPATMKYYESLFEIVREKRTSISRKAGLGGDARLTTTFQERKKHYGQEFNRLGQGQAFVFDQKGMNRKVHFDLLPVTPQPLQPIYDWTPVELKNNFDQILATARQLC